MTEAGKPAECMPPDGVPIDTKHWLRRGTAQLCVRWEQHPDTGLFGWVDPGAASYDSFVSAADMAEQGWAYVCPWLRGLETLVAIKDAVEAEREACAKIIENADSGLDWGGDFSRAARTIRARGAKS